MSASPHLAIFLIVFSLPQNAVSFLVSSPHLPNEPSRLSPPTTIRGGALCSGKIAGGKKKIFAICTWERDFFLRRLLEWIVQTLSSYLELQLDIPALLIHPPRGKEGLAENQSYLQARASQRAVDFSPPHFIFTLDRQTQQWITKTTQDGSIFAAVASRCSRYFFVSFTYYSYIFQ